MGDVLDQVDTLIRAVLLRDVAELTAPDQIQFLPPDEAWRTAVANLGRTALSVYLVDLRENAALRDHEWLLSLGEQGPQRDVGPTRVDCHYLISAWSPATVTPAIEPTLDEHRLLYAVMAALLRAEPLNATHVLPAAALGAFDELIRDADLPTQTVPAAGWPKLAEFWSSMGANSRWKPALWFSVTIPVAMTRQVAGPLVTTRIIEFRQGDDAGTAESWAQIGGTVSTPAGVPVDGAVVTVRGTGGRIVGAASTGPDGRFSIGALHVDGYTLDAAKPGTGTAQAVTGVPGPAGGFDLTLT